MTRRFHRIKIPKKPHRRSKSMLSELLSKHKPEYIIGIDEVGWGAVAGPVGVGCTVYKVGYENKKIKDSKKYTENSRVGAYALVHSTACFTDYIAITVQELELHGPGPMLQATFKTLAERALAQFPNSVVIIDGSNEIKDFEGPQYAFPKADALVCAVSAASIIAKVSRDRHMKVLHTEFPEFKWAENKGYGTPDQVKAMTKHGVTVHHRHNIQMVLDCEEKCGKYERKGL